ncbi:MAG: ABC transporter permease [Planctomycetaceae bacterium]|jgi:lipopolysaccharide transport system permease protein|nr:ABC transporter permease [Planctomycetaceae bacterium]
MQEILNEKMSGQTGQVKDVSGRSRITVIEMRRPGFGVDIFELWRYRYLIWLYVYRDFVVLYKQTVLGMFWWLLQPFLTTIVFTVVFGGIVGIATEGVPKLLFYLSGITLWNYFLYCFLHTSQSFIDNRELFKKVYFPRLVIPIAAIASNLMRFVLQLTLLVFFYIIFLFCGVSVFPTVFIFCFPALVLYVAVLAFGFGLLAASLTTKYRDIMLALPFFMQLWMYASVVLFPFSLVPERWQFWFSLNPLVPAIEIFRYMCFGTDNFAISSLSILSCLILAIVLLFAGIFAFNYIDKTFTDSI